jgi:uncharacterized protein (TIGR03083 family)
VSADGAEMRALAELLDCLTDEQWNAQSLCDEWRVRDVVAHMTAGAEGAFGVRAVIVGLLRNRFDHNRWIATDGRARGQQAPSALLSGFRAAADLRDARSGADSIAALAHILIHGQDVCRPLGIKRGFSDAHLLRVADFTATSFVLGTKRRIKGLQLRAADVDWTHGSGAEVSGPIEALIMAMAGRSVAFADLSGDGLARFQALSS